MSFPDVSGAFWGWSVKSLFISVQKVAVDFEVVENLGSPPFDFGGYGQGNYAALIFVGVLEPLPDRKLMIKPEGQRTWKWWTLWTKKPLELDDIIVDKPGRIYRVMSQSDWSSGRYYQYDLTENVPPQPVSNA